VAVAPLDVRRVLGEMVAVYRERWAFLLGTGLLVFIPVGLVEAIDNPLEDADTAAREALSILELVALVGAQSAVPLLTTVVYAGIVVSAVVARRQGSATSLARVARTLPLGGLIGADLLYALVVVAGFLMFLVPGLVFLVWFALVAPAIKLEHRGIHDAFSRSRFLVRPHFWKVTLLVIPGFFAEGILAELVESGATSALGETFVGGWVGSVVGNLVGAPIIALASVVLFFELRGGER